ncbi:cysteine desulfurase family protein [Desulfobacca acetoxidans]|uniref:cysteine desulfurase n=1 Tax=Desulfobacca acetoxidans (strain ATCC 700848 / DSM 11109 / ASRB2) TaxID=880072 RepID=F2NJV6_DESAR|nr:cysteine desulfurase family protein [Desulfobacca acetoxidans]AEB09900.1 Cysteine desulfurase [Desulfobacca acetoxidans DSM 11109]
MIYLDHNATTPIAPEVAAGIQIFLQEEFGNPSSDYPLGQRAKAAVQQSRSQVAALLGAQPEEIVFLSGASEANNWVLKGVAHHLQQKGRHLITTVIEHPAVLNPCLFLMEEGWEVDFIKVDSQGRVDPDDVRRACKPQTVLISIMHANNETGAIQPLAEVGRFAREYGILFHTDAAQSVGKIPTIVDELGVDFLTVAGHKFYAPKGIGALYIRRGVVLTPLLHGASQEGGRRAGTENVIFANALGLACELARNRQPQDREHFLFLRDRLHRRLQEGYPDLVLNGPETARLPNTLNVSFPGLSGADILAGIPELAASTGAACHGPGVRLSHVLASMGVSREVGKGAVRLSVGRSTTAAEVDQAAALLLQRVQALSAVS